MARRRYKDEDADMESPSSIWRDLSQIKLGYLVLLGICVFGGTVFRFMPEDDAVEASARVRSGEVKTAPANYIQVQEQNMAYIEAIDIGTSQQAVVQAIGQPDFRQWYSNGFEMFMYRVERKIDDFLTTKDETAALVFQDGKLVGFNRTGKWFDTSVVHNDNPNYLDDQENMKLLLMELRDETPRTSIIESLGRPDFVDYPAEDFEILSYRTQVTRMDNQTSRDETTPILLHDGKSVAKGLVEVE